MSTTGVSNPNATSQRGDAAPAVGRIFKCAMCGMCMVSSVLDGMQARTAMPTYPRLFMGLRPMCRRAAAMPARRVVLLHRTRCRRIAAFAVRPETFFTCHPSRAVHDTRAGVSTYAGRVLLDASRVATFIRTGTILIGVKKHAARRTDCTWTGALEEIGGNLWEDTDDCSLRRAHAPAWAAPPVREFGVERREEDVKKPFSLCDAWLFSSAPARQLFRN